MSEADGIYLVNGIIIILLLCGLMYTAPARK